MLRYADSRAEAIDDCASAPVEMRRESDSRQLHRRVPFSFCPRKNTTGFLGKPKRLLLQRHLSCFALKGYYHHFFCIQLARYVKIPITVSRFDCEDLCSKVNIC